MPTGDSVDFGCGYGSQEDSRIRNVARAANQGNKEAIKLRDLHCPLAAKALEHARQAFEIRFWGSR